MKDKTNETQNVKTETAMDFLTELREFAITVGEDCPEGHRRDPGSGRCLPISGLDHTEFTRSQNVDYGPEWRGEVDKDQASMQETAVDASEMEELESCAEGTTFSFIQKKCITIEEAEEEDAEEFARTEEGEPIEEEVEDAAAPGQGGHEEITMMQPEGRRDTVNHMCPANMFFDYKLRKCIPLNKDTVMASEDFSEEFKKDVAMYARLAMTTPDPMDGHKHVATLDEDGNGTTSMAGYGDYTHSHAVKKFVVQDADAGGKTSKHPGVAVPEEMEIEKPEHYGEAVPSTAAEKEEAAPITTKQRKGLPDSSFGVPGKRKFPLDTCARVRNAMARFNQAKGLTSGEKATLRRKIMSRAKACGIEVRNFAKATTDEEFAEVARELMRMEKVPTQTRERMEAYKVESGAKKQGPCPPGMEWDSASLRCSHTRGFVKEVSQHADIVRHQPEGRRDPIGFRCPTGWFFDFTNRRCLPLDPSQKPGTTTTKAEEEDAQSRKLVPNPPGKPAKLPQDCPKGMIWDKKREDCVPLDSRQKTKSEEEDSQTTPSGPGKEKDTKGCGPGEFFNPVSKKCMPRKGAFKGKSGSEDAANAMPGNREGLTPAPAGKARLPSDCPEGTTWDAKNKLCRPLDSMDKSRPSGSSPQNPRNTANVDDFSVARLIKELDAIIEESSGKEKERTRVEAKDLPNAAFPPSLVTSSKRIFMHHVPGVEDPYDHSTVDAARLRNALARCNSATEQADFTEKALADGMEHLLYHARQIVRERVEKKELSCQRSAEGQITNPAEFHPLCQPQEVFDPKSGSCIPATNVKGAEPRGTLECPSGYVLDPNLNLCVPEGSRDQAQALKLTDKMERCIRSVKSNLTKTRKGMDSQTVKSTAIAICRSRMKASEELAFHMPPEDRMRLSRALYHLVVDNFAMAIKGYNFHWNVMSPIFEDLHAMFGEDYGALLADADALAERIRALGFSSPASLTDFTREASIQDQTSAPLWQEMVNEWVSDHIHMAEEARMVQKIAEEVGDNNTLAMLDSMILCHDKRAWMFRSLVSTSPDSFPS